MADAHATEWVKNPGPEISGFGYEPGSSKLARLYRRDLLSTLMWIGKLEGTFGSRPALAKANEPLNYLTK